MHSVHFACEDVAKFMLKLLAYLQLVRSFIDLVLNFF